MVCEVYMRVTFTPWLTSVCDVEGMTVTTHMCSLLFPIAAHFIIL